MFCQQLGGAIFVSIGQNVFNHELGKALNSVAGIQPAAVVATGATELRKTVDPANLAGVLSAYNGAIVKVFEAALAIACLFSLELSAWNKRVSRKRTSRKERKQWRMERSRVRVEESREVDEKV